jgi:septation ring formation regulator EzrA
MDSIDQKLAELELTLEQLPDNIQKLIQSIDVQNEKLEKQILEYNESGEKNDEVEKKFDDMYNVIEGKEDFVITKLQEFKQTLTKEKETNDPAPTNDGEKNNPKPNEKKKGGAIKWIVGGAILLLTLGAVNTMNRE